MLYGVALKIVLAQLGELMWEWEVRKGQREVRGSWARLAEENVTCS